MKVSFNDAEYSNSLVHQQEETRNDVLQVDIKPKPSMRNTKRLERKSQSGKGLSDLVLRTPSSRRSERGSLDRCLSQVSGLNSLKSNTVVPFSNTAGIISSNKSAMNLASTVTVEPVCYSSGMSNKTPETSRSVIDSSRETFSLSAEEAIAGLGLDRNGLQYLKKNFNLIDEDGNGMIDKVEFLRALRETDENGDIISDFTGSLVIIATRCDLKHCIPNPRLHLFL